MGGKPSVEYDNDFELVVRSTKELEWLLVTHFHAPDGSRDNTCGLHEKITAATHQGRPLSDDLKRRMRKIVTHATSWCTTATTMRSKVAPDMRATTSKSSRSSREWPGPRRKLAGVAFHE